MRYCWAATFGECPSHGATTWTGYFSTQSVSQEARRFCRTRGQGICPALVMIRSRCVRRFTVALAADGTTTADRAGVYSRSEGVSGGRVRRVVRAE
ncbi:MAG: hypothetical protein EBZ59_04395 [Planctomycetia bacterium]|nr:hypothetical protein [Planctomycetia bacterium]